VPYVTRRKSEKEIEMGFLEIGKARKQFSSASFPRSIGLSLPGSYYDYEFLVCGKNTSFTQNQVLRTFIEHGVMLVSLNSAINQIENKFILNVICNLENADLGPAELISILQETRLVITAEYSEVKGRLFGRNLAGLTFNNRHRAVALRSDAMIKLGRSLTKDSGSIGASTLYRQGREYAHGIVEEVRQILDERDRQLGYSVSYLFDSQQEINALEPNMENGYCMKCRAMRPILNQRQVTFSNKTQAIEGVCPSCSTKIFKIGAKIYSKITPNLLIENAQDYLASAGWGTFELRTDVDGRLGEVVIADPPSLSNDASYGNQFVQGIAAGLLEAASSNRNRMIVVGERYNSEAKTLYLHFAEQIPVRKTRTKNVAKAEKNENPKEPTDKVGPGVISGERKEAVEEVDRIIEALEKIESDAKPINEDQQQKSLEREPIVT
jgi:Domain of unknown function (DUF5679)